MAGGGMAATVPRFLPRAPLMNSEACQLGPLGKVTAVGWRALPYVPLANAISHRERVFMTSKLEFQEAGGPFAQGGTHKSRADL